MNKLLDNLVFKTETMSPKSLNTSSFYYGQAFFCTTQGLSESGFTIFPVDSASGFYFCSLFSFFTDKTYDMEERV